jgi:hypothetical protein
MRLVSLKTERIKVEGKFGSVILEQDSKSMSVTTKPDTGCHSRIKHEDALGYKGHMIVDANGHTIIMEKRS